MNWVSFFVIDMQKNKISIKRGILDEFLSLSLVIKTMENLNGVDNNFVHKKKLRLDASNFVTNKINGKGRNLSDGVIINKKSQNAEENFDNWSKIQKIWKKLNVNSQIFNPIVKSKSLSIGSQSFKPLIKKKN